MNNQIQKFVFDWLLVNGLNSRLRRRCEIWYTYKHTHAYIHRHIYANTYIHKWGYIYIYIYVCVCVCAIGERHYYWGSAYTYAEERLYKLSCYYKTFQGATCLVITLWQDQKSIMINHVPSRVTLRMILLSVIWSSLANLVLSENEIDVSRRKRNQSILINLNQAATFIHCVTLSS